MNKRKKLCLFFSRYVFLSRGHLGQQLEQRGARDTPSAEQLVGSKAPTPHACSQAVGWRAALQETCLRVPTHSLGHALNEETALDDRDAEQESGWFF